MKKSNYRLWAPDGPPAYECEDHPSEWSVWYPHTVLGLYGMLGEAGVSPDDYWLVVEI